MFVSNCGHVLIPSAHLHRLVSAELSLDLQQRTKIKSVMSYYDDINYAGNRTIEYNTENTIAYESGHTIRDDADRVERFDLLFFLSVALTCDAQDYTSVVLLSICLGPWKMFFPITLYRGAFSSVTLLTRRDLLRRTAVGRDSRHPIPKMVALKTPILDENLHSSRNSRLFRSIAKEYQILKSESLRNHENIVTLFGCCWQTIDVRTGLPVPSLILVGTVLGDLEQFSTLGDICLSPFDPWRGTPQPHATVENLKLLGHQKINPPLAQRRIRYQ